MLAKKTVKNQITLPKDIVGLFPNTDYFDVQEEGGRIILTPLKQSRADEVRKKLKTLGIRPQDVGAAISWARKR